MTDKRVYRFSMAFALLAFASGGPFAHAQSVAIQKATTKAGVQVAVPAALRKAPGLAGHPDPEGKIEHVFTDDSSEPLTVVVQTGGGQPLANLPAADGTAAQEWARGFAEGLGVPDAYDITPTRYDPERGAMSLEYKVRGPSTARVMLSLPDTHPVWAPTLQANGTTDVAKCLLTMLLDDRRWASVAELEARYAAAASECGMSASDVAEYVEQVGLADFAPGVSSINCLAFFTRLGSTVTLIITPLQRKPDADALAALMWEHSVIEPGLRLPVDLSNTTGGRIGAIIGTLLGAFLAVCGLGGLVAWLLVKLGVRARWAVLGSFAILVGWCLFGVLRADVVTLREGGLRIAGFLTFSLLGYRPLTRWLQTRARRAGGTAEPPQPQRAT